MRRRTGAIGIFLLLAAANVSPAAEWFVATNGSDAAATIARRRPGGLEGGLLLAQALPGRAPPSHRQRTARRLQQRRHLAPNAVDLA